MTQKKKKTSKKSRNLIDPKFLILALFALVLVIWVVFASADKSLISNNRKSVLENENNAACAQVNNREELHCEDLRSGEVKQFSVPEKYQGSYEIIPSPDGTKLLVHVSSGDIVVTDSSFKEVKKVFKPGTFKDGMPAIVWADGSSKLLMSEIKREQGDANFLPKPLVVKLYDLNTGQSHRVYKTGENVDVESIKVLGSDGEYVFLAMSTPKNWVAKDVDAPFETINAIRLSDGYVLSVDTSQIYSNAEAAHVSYLASSYDSGRKLFTFTGSKESETVVEGYVIVANFTNDENGPTLQNVYESSGKNIAYDPIFTSKGIAISNFEEPLMYRLLDEHGNTTELRLPVDTLYALLSLQSMPNLPSAN